MGSPDSCELGYVFLELLLSRLSELGHNMDSFLSLELFIFVVGVIFGVKLCDPTHEAAGINLNLLLDCSTLERVHAGLRCPSSFYSGSKSSTNETSSTPTSTDMPRRTPLLGVHTW